MELKEDPDKGVYVKGLTKIVVENCLQIDAVMAQGKKTYSPRLISYEIQNIFGSFFSL